MNDTAVVGGIIGIVGSLLLYVLQRWATRGDREAKQLKSDAKQKQVVDDANLKLAGELRAELRRDNEELRERQRLTDQKLAATEARLEDVLKTNATLHQDNLTLTEKNGALAERVKTLTEQLKAASTRADGLEERLRIVQSDNITLINAMRTAGIPIPPLESERKPGTGPLGHGG